MVLHAQLLQCPTTKPAIEVDQQRWDEHRGQVDRSYQHKFVFHGEAAHEGKSQHKSNTHKGHIKRCEDHADDSGRNDESFVVCHSLGILVLLSVF